MTWPCRIVFAFAIALPCSQLDCRGKRRPTSPDGKADLRRTANSSPSMCRCAGSKPDAATRHSSRRPAHRAAETSFAMTPRPRQPRSWSPPRFWCHPARHSPLDLDDYAFSADRSRLLIFTNSQRVWRTNTRGDYWVLDRSSHELRKLGGDAPPASLMHAKFAPGGLRVAYVRSNNIYVEDLRDHRITRLTKSTSPDEINGTFDWVYEEEFGLRDGFRFSPDGTRSHTGNSTPRACASFRSSITPTHFIPASTRSSIPRWARPTPLAASVSSHPPVEIRAGWRFPATRATTTSPSWNGRATQTTSFSSNSTGARTRSTSCWRMSAPARSPPS